MLVDNGKPSSSFHSAASLFATLLTIHHITARVVFLKYKLDPPVYPMAHLCYKSLYTNRPATALTAACAVLCDLASACLSPGSPSSATLAFSRPRNPPGSLLPSDICTCYALCMECSSSCFSLDSLPLLSQVSVSVTSLKRTP